MKLRVSSRDVRELGLDGEHGLVPFAAELPAAVAAFGEGVAVWVAGNG